MFERDGQRVVGFHLMGVRYRQAVCEAWIAAGRHLPYVLAHLADAHFDAEFTAGHVRAVRARYAQQFPQAAPLRPARRRWWQRVR